MLRSIPYIPATKVEATVSSKGQVTLPKALRIHLGIQTGSRLRFSLDPLGGFRADPVLYDLEDIWKMADEGAHPGDVLSFEEMDAAKARRTW
ncbi:AbrB/MazE/SpoVT family DNA-binding domain-containing protein [Holophaga foetida]|uniref:AbrB/MazE/SpoVT family DNA-binding domain-containing protein n=1 Tax=Holophaga foetida TaxID=35839 RepID=UPI0002473F23|nr:AbrB/MazE/SpoVT family DNA-binding domain-containing protein [Holophaga foetida]